MKRNVIYVVDENPPARRSNTEALRRLLDDGILDVRELPPLPHVADYNPLIALPNVAAFVLDQRMKQSGVTDYNGTDLAAHMRSINPKVPIYILTGYPNEHEDFDGWEHLVEYIIGKPEIADSDSKDAKKVKARMQRHLNVFNDVQNEREQRFHDLLVKSLKETLSPEEQDEMDRIEGETTIGVLSAERKKERELGEQVEKLRAFVDKNKLSLE